MTNPLEWWPSRTAAEQALLDRIAPPLDTVSRCRVNHADGRTVEDAQYYGGSDSRIYLYEVTGEPGTEPAPLAAAEPYAVLEFGPRGGVRHRVLAVPAQ